MSGPADLGWPNGARSCVMLAFDVDGPTGSLLIDGSIWSRPRHFGLGGYGPFRGLARLLAVLAVRNVPATFFVPAWVVEQWPQQCRAIVDSGHEVAHHGYRHELFAAVPVAEQEQIICRSQAVFERVLGVRAVGFRTPTGDWHVDTPRLLLDHGFRYTSSLRDADCPYRVPIGGVSSELLEIPAKVELDDFAYYAFHREPAFPAGQDRVAPYTTALRNWQLEFDGHHAAGGCLTTIFHPKFSGTPGRARILGEFIDHMLATDGVWFATGREIADWYWTAGA